MNHTVGPTSAAIEARLAAKQQADVAPIPGIWNLSADKRCHTARKVSQHAAHGWV